MRLIRQLITAYLYAMAILFATHSAPESAAIFIGGGFIVNGLDGLVEKESR